MQTTLLRTLFGIICVCNILAASSHPLGNFSLNHYSYIKVYPQGILSQHVLDFAEIPSFNELANVDKDNNNFVSQDEQNAYLESLKETILPSLLYTIQVDGQAVQINPEMIEPNILLSHGQAGMTCIQIQLAAKIPLPDLKLGQTVKITFLDDNLKHIRGFREVRISAQNGVSIQKDSVSNENNYPVVNPVDGVFGMEGLSAAFTYTVNTIQSFDMAKTSPVESFIDPASIPLMPIEAEDDGSYSIIKSPIQPNQEVQSKISMLQPKTSVTVADVMNEAPTGNTEDSNVSPDSGVPNSSETEIPNSMINEKGDDEWSRLISEKDLSPWFMFTAIALSIMYGMAHALSPGHGKTVVAAYLIGSRGTVLHAIFLGIIVTLTHVSSVILLGLIVLYFQSYIQSDLLFAIVEGISGLLIIWIGSILFFKRYNAYQKYQLQEAVAAAGHAHYSHSHQQHNHGNSHTQHDHGHPHHDPKHEEQKHEHNHDHHGHDHHGHDHPHPHEHPHKHEHSSGHDHPHNHEAAHTHEHKHDHNHDHHHHEHDHPHSHDHSHEHPHDHEHKHEHKHEATHHHDHPQPHPHTHDHSHDHHHGHDHHHEHGHPHHHHHGWLEDDHEHGDHTHTHEIPADATWWDLLVLGITGGIVPCPAAVLVLLIAIATHRLVFGMVLILFFSMGLAAVLIAIGITMVVAKTAFDRFSDQGKFSRMLQIVSPALVTVLGFVIIFRALVTGGWISLNI